ncbi:MAG TPA: DUF4147 domain-containing protein, partial [Polyangia bacterium]|nr:DUF4147 domain-containing protein [Polyangia bacterium]
MSNPEVDVRLSLAELFAATAARLDGEALVASALAGAAALTKATHVLAVGKVALPMWRGWASTSASMAQAQALAVVPAPLVPDAPPEGSQRLQILAADHPQPTERSVAAARAVATFVAGLVAGRHRLLVLLSGGSSALLCAPADGLALADKRAAVGAVAAAGATIGQLNTVRKHLSAIKGGRLALLTSA